MENRILKQGLLANPTVGIAVSSVDGKITETNSTFRNIIGYSEAELAKLTFNDLCHNEDKKSEQKERRKLIEGNSNHLSVRQRYLNESGKSVWVDTDISVIRNAEGTCEALVSTMTEATERRRLELLQQGQTRVLNQLNQNCSLEEICTSIVETIETVEKGLLCSILRLNSTTETLHKIVAPNLPDFYNDTIEGMPIGDDIGSCGAAAFHKRRVIVDDILNHPNWQRVRRLVEKTSLRSCWSQPIFDNDGQVLGTFGIYYTEPRQPGPFELELISSAADLTALAINHKKAMVALQQSNDLKNEFISTAAHEMMTPIASIMGYAELLRYSQGPELAVSDNSDEFLDVIVQKAEMLSRIIGDLLDTSNIENGYDLELIKKPVSFHKTMSNVVDHFKRHAPKHDFNLNTINDFPETVTVDEERITQVLDNLLSNAVKYSPEGGLVELVAEAKHDKLHISVTDSGVGMSEEQLERVFDKFYRANTSDSTVKGLGLGMGITREIIEAHGGEIKVKSAQGVGTQVQFTVAHG